MPAGNGSPLGSPAWPRVLKPKFIVAGASGRHDETGIGINGPDSSVGLLARQGEG